jgi:diadenosine tetraphosphate (Ap4A) HIT family hydrolase
VNQTIEKFGYPESLIHESSSWVVLLRPKQVTLGCAVLACKEDATTFGDVSPEAYAELAEVTRSLEAALQASFAPQKLNLLALMMVDPHVHFHVVPRYSEAQEFAGVDFPDKGWPKHPDMQGVVATTLEVDAKIREILIANWPK